MIHPYDPLPRTSGQGRSVRRTGLVMARMRSKHRLGFVRRRTLDQYLIGEETVRRTQMLPQLLQPAVQQPMYCRFASSHDLRHLSPRPPLDMVQCDRLAIGSAKRAYGDLDRHGTLQCRFDT